MRIECVKRIQFVRFASVTKVTSAWGHAVSRRILESMVQTKTPPFRADHVGSLLRPPELLKAREEEKNGRISPAELRRIEDQAIRDVVAQQEDLGLEGVTDGEFRR